MFRVWRIDDRSFQADAGQTGALPVVFPESPVETGITASATAGGRAKLSGWFRIAPEERTGTSRRVRCRERSGGAPFPREETEGTV